MVKNCKQYTFIGLILLLGLLLASCRPQLGGTSAEQAQAAESDRTARTYTLVTASMDGKMAFVGKGGEIDGQTNPVLHATPGSILRVTLINGDGAEHDFTVSGLDVASERISSVGSQTELIFKVHQDGAFRYHSSVPGQSEAGMVGYVGVGTGYDEVSLPEPSDSSGTTAANSEHTSGASASESAASDSDQAAENAADAESAADIVFDPADLPKPVGNRGPEKVNIKLETVELTGQLADGTTFNYWTFNGKVPGPFLRVRVGDTVELSLTNKTDSLMTHSIDLHAVNGPGGGAVATQVMPGEEKAFTFKALNPGLYVYHCATPMVAHHMTNGMYGLILVEPEGGLPEVDREFYVMQGEIYTTASFGEKGHVETDINKLLAETPDYFVLNGAVGALTDQKPLHANVGETVRIYFGVGGPNFTSSFHVIGEIFDRVYDQASLTSAPLTNVQTTVVPPGGATMVEFKIDVPGRYLLVDHALSRLEHGLVGFLVVEGPENREVFDAPEMDESGH